VEFNASRLHLPRFRLSTAADLCVETVSVASDTSNLGVLELFTERRELMSLPVIEQDRPIGLISRNIFMSQMSKPYYHELYGKKSCIAFMDKDPLIVDAAMSIEADLPRRGVGRKSAGRRIHRQP
jgi:predicted transcriptional regulator